MGFNWSVTQAPSVEGRNIVSKGKADPNRVFRRNPKLTKHPNCVNVFSRLRVAEVRRSIKVDISESELRKLSDIYPRLYQIPKASQELLRAWINKNRHITLGWEFADFLKTKNADILEDTKPREPGYPSGATEKGKTARVCLAKNKDNIKISSSTTQASKRRSITTQLSPIASIYSTTIQDNDRYEQHVEATCPEGGASIIDANSSSITQGGQGNQSNHPEHPLLSSRDGSINTTGPSPDITPQSNQSNCPEYPLPGSHDKPFSTLGPSSNTTPQSYRNDYLEYPLLESYYEPDNNSSLWDTTFQRNECEYPEDHLLILHSGPDNTSSLWDTTFQRNESDYPEYPLLMPYDDPSNTSPLWDTTFQSNESDHPVYPILSPLSGLINTLGPSPDTAPLTPYQPCNGQAFADPGYTDEQHYDGVRECSGGVPVSLEEIHYRQAGERNDSILADAVDEQHHGQAGEWIDSILVGEVGEQHHERIKDCIIVAYTS